MTKLEQLFPSRLRHRVAALSAAVETVPNRRDPVPPDVLAAVAAACQASEQLRFDYLDRHQSTTHRRVEPYRVVQVTGRWYLVAYDLDRDDWRSFRVDRVEPKTPTGPKYVPRDLPGPDLATFVTRGRMTALWNYRSRVVIDAPAEVVAARIPTGAWIVEPLDDHTSQLDAGAHSPELLVVYLGALGLDFHIDPEHAPDLTDARVATTARTQGSSTGTPRLASKTSAGCR